MAPDVVLDWPIASTGRRNYNFVTLDAGGTYQTLLYGINNNGVVTGIALDPNNNFFGTGVVFNGGGPVPCDRAPGAVDTEFYQVNTAGQIATSYFGADGIYHAAVYDSVNSTWTQLPDVAGYAENLAGGINNHGVVAGDPFVNSSFRWGCGMDPERIQLLAIISSATRIRPDEVLGTATYSINDAGQSVGYFQDSSGVTHGYLKTGSNFTTLDAPGANGTTSAQGINNQGYVTGYYTDASGTDHGYLWHNGQFTTIDVNIAGATGTDITAINDQGDLVGWYLDANGALHGSREPSLSPGSCHCHPDGDGAVGNGLPIASASASRDRLIRIRRPTLRPRSWPFASDARPPAGRLRSCRGRRRAGRSPAAGPRRRRG